MVKRVRALIVKYWDVISYLFFGGLTTVVSFVVSNGMFYLFGWDGWSSELISWVVAVAFAYLTNKPFVFKSHDWSMQTVIPELAKFIGCRVGSGLLETVIIFVTVDLLTWDGNIMKLITSVLVVILNYIGSKLLVFRKN